jgi:hypothetical protein
MAESIGLSSSHSLRTYRLTALPAKKLDEPLAKPQSFYDTRTQRKTYFGIE